jgi:hypothetical protein
MVGAEGAICKYEKEKRLERDRLIDGQARNEK